MIVSEVPSEPVLVTDDVPAGKVRCPEPGCSKIVSVTASGRPRAHACLDESGQARPRAAARSPGGGARGGRSRARRGATPAVVRTRGAALVALGAEVAAERAVLASTSLTEAALVPRQVTTLGHPEAMCGPLIDLLWQLLPDPVQSTISRLAEHDTLIECAVMWYLWGEGIKKFIDSCNEANHPGETLRNVTPVAPSYAHSTADSDAVGWPRFTSGRSA